MRHWFRLAWVACLAWLVTACARFPVGDVAQQVLPSIVRTPLRVSTAGSVVIDSGDRFGRPISINGPSRVLTARAAGVFIGSSPIRLLENGDGSVSVFSGDGSFSLLHGLDPALVNPALIPFLFPSCDVPFLP